jgi:hypothetical protein
MCARSTAFTACPVEAIYADSDIPDKWKNYIEINAEFYKN